MEINPKKLNPVGFHLMKLMQDITIRFIILFGGSSSGKTYSVAQMVLIFTLWEGTNTLVMRKVGASIKDSIYQDFVTAASQLGISKMFKFSDGVKTIKCLTNGARIVFKGLDDSEKIKGLSSFKRVVMDEWSEFDEEDFKQIRLRLRGMEGQQIICTFNPIKVTHWIKKKFFDTQKWHDVPMEIKIAGSFIPSELTAVKSIRMNEPREIMHKRTGEIIHHEPDTVVIQTTYLNNFWVVGSPDGTYGYYDEQCIATFEFDRLNDPDYYNVYALGEWGVIRTGSEFFGSFNRGKHSKEVSYNSALPVHICVDSNVLPYITCTYWQVDIGAKTTIYQFDETLASSPNNTVRKSAKLVAKRLRELAPDKIFIHGDASTRASNNIDDEKRSFLDLFIDTLHKEGIEVEDKVSTKNPSVPMSGEFINAIFDEIMPGYEIVIGENCNTSIEDYMSVQKDVNGAILKTKVKNKITMQTYEEHGHCCFTPDTPVLTINGYKPICDVRTGDVIITETGCELVYNSLCSIRKSQYFLVTLCGKTLNCTYEHPISTQRGFVPINQLKTGDILTLTSNGKIWKEKLSSITDLDFIVTVMGNVKVIGNTIVDGLGLKGNSSKLTYTGIFGFCQMAKFLKAIVCIILMVITTITHLITLLLCLLLNTRSCIRNYMVKKLGEKLKKGLKYLKIRPEYGIRLKKGENGTLKTVNDNGNIVKKESLFVNVVVKPLRLFASRLRNFALTTAKANGVETTVMTMKNVFARYVGLNLLSINTLRRSAVHGNVLLNLGGISDVYDISTTSHTFFANGVLVHNSDTFRYIVTDVLRDEFLLFSNRRKRNLYAKDGTIHFFNPDTDYQYSRDIVYAQPNINGKYVMVHGKMCGDRWHIVSVAFRETTSTEEIRQSLVAEQGVQTIVECASAYYRFVRELRKDIPSVRVMNEASDIDQRIAATSDFVREHLLFNETKLSDDVEYAQFMNNMLDYNKDSDSKEASAVLSGFIKFVVKFVFENISDTNA